MFDVNALIGLIIIVGIILLCYTHIEHLTNEVTYVKSIIDNREYLVRNAPNKKKRQIYYQKFVLPYYY